MWRAVLVDDEEYVRAELAALFPWDRFGFCLTGEAENAQAAMELIERVEPDLVITDIRMPETDGLELTAWIGQHYPQLVVAIVSAYDDFSFVREALRLGAADYLIKAEATPGTAGVFLERISGVLKNRHSAQHQQEKLADNLERYHQLALESFWRDALTGATDGLEIELRAKKLGIALKNRWFGLIFIHVSPDAGGMENNQAAVRRDLEEKLRSIWDWNWDWQVVGFKQGDFSVVADQIGETTESNEIERLENIAIRLVSDFPKKTATSISSKICSFHDLPENFREAREVNLVRLYHREGRYLKKSDLVNLQQSKYPQIPELLSDWDSLLRGIEPEAIQVFLNDLFENVIPKCFSPEEARKLVLELVNALYRISFEYQVRWTEVEEEGLDPAELIDRVESVRDWQILIEKPVEHYIRSIRGITQPQGSLTIRKALAFIQANFTRDLTLEEVAGHAGVSKSYLSRIFPEYAGKHFCSYLQQLRIERAKELLRFTDEHIYEIASKVGFWNSRYFCKVFRDTVGMTPADYRRIIPD